MAERVEIERMAQGPEAIGHLASGKTVFVANVAPGDIVEVEITQEKKTFARAKALKLLEVSPDRSEKHAKLTEDLAESAMAPWAHLAYRAQLDAKQANVRSALRRTAHLSPDEIDDVLQEIVPSEKQWGYRNKLEFTAKPDANGRICIGIHAEGTHDFVSIKEAPLGNSLICNAPKSVQGALRYLCGNDDLGIYRVGVRGSERTESVEVALWTPPSSFPRSFAAKLAQDGLNATSVVRVIADPGASRKVKRVEVLGGDGYWQERMSYGEALDEEFDFRVSAPSFFQVNTEQAQKMVELVMDGVGNVSGANVADLYSGVGTFSFPLAAAGADVCAVELEGSSSRDFRRNAELDQVDAQIICDDVALALPKLGHLDAVVVDPPRAGLDERVTLDLATNCPDRIVYGSCDVQTLARDIERLRENGYRLARVTPLDMFPQTYHVECVAVFARA